MEPPGKECTMNSAKLALPMKLVVITLTVLIGLSHFSFKASAAADDKAKMVAALKYIFENRDSDNSDKIKRLNDLKDNSAVCSRDGRICQEGAYDLTQAFYEINKVETDDVELRKAIVDVLLKVRSLTTTDAESNHLRNEVDDWLLARATNIDIGADNTLHWEVRAHIFQGYSRQLGRNGVLGLSETTMIGIQEVVVDDKTMNGLVYAATKDPNHTIKANAIKLVMSSGLRGLNPATIDMFVQGLGAMVANPGLPANVRLQVALPALLEIIYKSNKAYSGPMNGGVRPDIVVPHANLMIVKQMRQEVLAAAEIINAAREADGDDSEEADGEDLEMPNPFAGALILDKRARNYSTTGFTAYRGTPGDGNLAAVVTLMEDRDIDGLLAHLAREEALTLGQSMIEGYHDRSNRSELVNFVSSGRIADAPDSVEVVDFIGMLGAVLDPGVAVPETPGDHPFPGDVPGHNEAAFDAKRSQVEIAESVAKKIDEFIASYQSQGESSSKLVKSLTTLTTLLSRVATDRKAIIATSFEAVVQAIQNPYNADIPAGEHKELIQSELKIAHDNIVRHGRYVTDADRERMYGPEMKIVEPSKQAGLMKDAADKVAQLIKVDAAEAHRELAEALNNHASEIDRRFDAMEQSIAAARAEADSHLRNLANGLGFVLDGQGRILRGQNVLNNNQAILEDNQITLHDHLHQNGDKLDGLIEGQGQLLMGQLSLEVGQARLEVGQARLEVGQLRSQSNQQEMLANQAVMLQALAAALNMLVDLDTTTRQIAADTATIKADLKTLLDLVQQILAATDKIHVAIVALVDAQQAAAAIEEMHELVGKLEETGATSDLIDEAKGVLEIVESLYDGTPLEEVAGKLLELGARMGEEAPEITTAAATMLVSAAKADLPAHPQQAEFALAAKGDAKIAIDRALDALIEKANAAQEQQISTMLEIVKPLTTRVIIDQQTKDAVEKVNQKQKENHDWLTRLQIEVDDNAEFTEEQINAIRETLDPVKIFVAGLEVIKQMTASDPNDPIQVTSPGDTELQRISTNGIAILNEALALAENTVPAAPRKQIK